MGEGSAEPREVDCGGSEVTADIGTDPSHALPKLLIYKVFVLYHIF